MIASSTIDMADLSRQKRFSTDLTDELTPDHSVGQAVEHYIDRMAIPDHGLRWTAFSRGRRLDRKSQLSELPREDTQWTIMPEVSAG